MGESWSPSVDIKRKIVVLRMSFYVTLKLNKTDILFFKLYLESLRLVNHLRGMGRMLLKSSLKRLLNYVGLIIKLRTMSQVCGLRVKPVLSLCGIYSQDK